MTYVETLGANAKKAKKVIGTADTKLKNLCLEEIAALLEENTEYILENNRLDIENGRKNNMADGLIDRLTLTPERIKGICEAVRKLISLDDPVGVTESGIVRPNGLNILKTRVPLGVVGIIYESRPNVTVDGATLCIKSGNAVILRGGKEAINSNKALVFVMRKALKKLSLPEDIVQLVEDTARETATALMKLDALDVLIPRGGAGLIKSVVQNATVPVIETGVGNCHIYVESSADFDMALDILENAKTSRVSVCNAAESLLVDKSIAGEFLPLAKKRLDKSNVQWYGCEETLKYVPDALKATDTEYDTEFLDYAISVKVVNDVEEAVLHIDRFGTGHSEVIVTNDIKKAETFLNNVDAAAVYLNASSRFTDGGEFGMGAEIGISTQKLHARGPMGLDALTSVKYKVIGNGQIR